MATAVKRKLSGSTDGKPIRVAATGSPGTVIHTAVAGTTPGTFDEVWLWASNSSANDLAIGIEFGDTVDPIEVTIPREAGLFLVIPGLILQNGAVVSSYAAVANVVAITGFVNSITD